MGIFLGISWSFSWNFWFCCRRFFLINGIKVKYLLRSTVFWSSEAGAARVDIRVRNFWRTGQSAYFDVRVTNLFSASSLKLPLSKIFDRHEKEKKRMHNNRILNVDRII